MSVDREIGLLDRRLADGANGRIAAGSFGAIELQIGQTGPIGSHEVWNEYNAGTGGIELEERLRRPVDRGLLQEDSQFTSVRSTQQIPREAYSCPWNS